MKLHLPKSLFAALLALWLPAVEAMTGWGSGANNYCIGVEGEIVTSIDAVGRDSVNMRADIQSNNYQMNASVGTLTLSEGAVVNITTSHWGTGRKFGMLTLNDIQVQNKGMVLLNVGADNGATVKNIDGVLGGVSNAGTLILGEEGGNMVLGGTLNNTGTMQVLSTLQLSPDMSALERHNVSETYSNAATGNGYATVTGSFYVAKNVALNQESISVVGSEERLALDTSSVEGATLVNSSYVTDEYYVNNGSVVVRGENSEVAEDARIVVNGGTAQLAGDALLSHFTYNSGSILVGAGHTLTVDQATDSATFCAVEGSGDVRVEQNVTLGAEGVTQATGDLTIANGARLQLGQGNGHNASIASFRSVTLDNGFVNLHNASTSINNMKVSSGGGAIHLDDMNWNQTLSLAGKTELEGAFSLSSTWKGIVDIEKVSGTGDMTITSWGNPYNNSMTVNIETLEDYSGDIQFNGGSQTVPATLNIGSIGSMGALTNSGAATILNIGADENSVHKLSHTMTVGGTLSLQGTINISEDLSHFLLKEEGAITSYSEGEDGYAYTSGSKYTIVDFAGGTLATPAETLAGMNERLSVYEDGDIIYTAGEVLSSVYHVRTQDVTLGGVNGSAIANNARKMVVAEGRTITVEGDMAHLTAADIVQSSTGAGNLHLKTNATLKGDVATQLTGKLTVSNGATLRFGESDDHLTQATSFSSVDLDNATLMVHSYGTSVNNLTVKEKGGRILLQSALWEGPLTVQGQTRLIGALKIENNGWDAGHCVAVLEEVSGSGDLNITSHHTLYNGQLKVQIDSLENYTGNIIFNSYSHQPATLAIGSIGSMGKLTAYGSSGILNIGADENSVHKLSHTMTVEGTLSLQGTINISEDLSHFLLKEEGAITSYSEGEDGYAYTSGSKYTIVDFAGGTLATPAETLAGMNERLSVYEDGDIVYTAEDVLSTVYHVRTKDITLGGTNGSVAANEASQMVVAEGRTITVEGDMSHLTAADIVLNSMGAGNLHLKTNASLSGNGATQLTGKLTVSNDALFWIGSGSNSRTLADSFSSVVLEQGTLGVSTSGSSINNLTVKENGGRLHLYATGQDEAFTIKGNTVLEGDFEIFTNGWDCSSNTVQMETVTGSGDMTITSYTSAYGTQLKVEIGTLKDYTGDVLFNSDGRQPADLIIGSIESMGKLTAYGTSGRIQLGAAADSVLNIDQTMTIGGRLTMQGSINLSEDLNGYKMKELGQVIRWSEQENGYAITKNSTYILADLQGGTLTNTAEELLAMNNKLFLAEDGDVVFIGGEHQGTTYYLRTRDVTVGGSNGHAAAASALQFDVAKGCTLTIAGASEHDTTGELVANTTGQGNILLTADATLMDDTITQGTGTLRVQGSGTTLQVGNNQYTKVDISSFNQIALEDGAEIVFLTSAATVQNFQVAAGGGTLKVSDLGTGNKDAVHLTGDTCLLGDLKLGNTYNAQILVDSLRGNGDIIVDSQRLENMYFTATSAADWKGNLYADFNGKSAGGLKTTIGGDWTGTAYISNSYGGTLDLTGYGSKATVSLSGNKTALQVDSATNAADIESAVCLNGTNEINDGPLGARLNFKGAVSGAGVLKLSADAGAEQLHLNFSGDTSRWTGSMEVAAGEHTVSFSKAATTVNNAEIKATGAATLHLNVGNTEAEITVNSAITYDADATLELYVNNSADTIFANTVQASSVRTAGKGMTTFLEEVSAAGIVLNGATMFTSTVVGDVQALATGSLVLGNAPVTIDGSFTGDVATLNLSKVYITSALLAEGEAALQPIVLLTTTGALTVENIDALVPGRLGLVYDEELYRAFLTLESSEDGSNALVLNVEAIPEPATATLSLLALAALASRRRRH